MKYITKEVRIGIAGIVALCVLIYGINWLKGIHTVSYTHLDVYKRQAPIRATMWMVRYSNLLTGALSACFPFLYFTDVLSANWHR